jgi:hypothetical protein
MTTESKYFFDEVLIGFDFQGKTYDAQGAYVDEHRCIGYLGADRKLYSCNGKALGAYRITATWRMPRTCFISSYQHQVEARINGMTYTGRSFGKGMIFKGRRLMCEIITAQGETRDET